MLARQVVDPMNQTRRKIAKQHRGEVSVARRQLGQGRKGRQPQVGHDVLRIAEPLQPRPEPVPRGRDEQGREAVHDPGQTLAVAGHGAPQVTGRRLADELRWFGRLAHESDHSRGATGRKPHAASSRKMPHVPGRLEEARCIDLAIH